ncbi:hypothetical protein [Gulosibacter sp. 10]|uniref:hypothetical protein n=1 Tax=Gulosibacter sp. 10 TaxID=1255570 RepID=UPI00097EA8D2|nr:hypothetical protein [Gulosibacter sp. 10]SJM50550.1 High molecular weight glutenin subunit x precursor [Gulosibacter sp. 10]
MNHPGHDDPDQSPNRLPQGAGSPDQEPTQAYGQEWPELPPLGTPPQAEPVPTETGPDLFDGLLAPGAEPEPQAEEEPSAPRRRGAAWLVTAMVVVLVLIVAVGFWWLNSDNASLEEATADGERGPKATETGGGLDVFGFDAPVETVDQYVGHIAEGEFSAANDLVDPATGLGEDDVVAAEALAHADSRVEVIGVERVEQTAETASVLVTLSLEGEEFEHTLSLTAEGDGSEKTWTIDRPLVTAVDIDAKGLPGLSIGGQTVALPDSASRLYLYPGIYTIGAEAGEYFTVEGDPETVEVASPSGSAASVSFDAKPNSKFEDAVLSQVRDRIDRCVQVPDNMDGECPSITRDTDLKSLTVSSQASGLDSVSATSFTSSDAKITVVGNSSSSKHSQTFQVRGDIVMEEGAPKIVNVSSS